MKPDDRRFLTKRADRIDFEPTTRTFSAIATTAYADLVDEVVVPEGLDTTYIAANRAVLWNHDSGTPIARLRNPPTLVKFGAGKAWRIAATMSRSAFAGEVWSMMREGVVSGVSIGFVPDEVGRPTREEEEQYGAHRSIVRRGRMVEVSVVAIPANVQARIDGMVEAPGEEERVELAVAAGALSRKSADLILKSLAPRVKRRTIVLLD